MRTREKSEKKEIKKKLGGEGARGGETNQIENGNWKILLVRSHQIKHRKQNQ